MNCIQKLDSEKKNNNKQLYIETMNRPSDGHTDRQLSFDRTLRSSTKHTQLSIYAYKEMNIRKPFPTHSNKNKIIYIYIIIIINVHI